MPIPNCHCRIHYSCDVMRSARLNHNLLYVIRVLIELNEDLNVVKSQILLLDPLPMLNKIFSMATQHECQISSIPVSTDESKILENVVDHRRPPFKISRYKICTFYGKSGQTIDICYRKHGVPPHLLCNPSSNAYNAHTDYIENVHPDSSCNPQNDHQTPPYFTIEQYHSLMSLLQASNMGKPSTNTSFSNQVSSFHSVGHQSTVNTRKLSSCLCLVNNLTLGSWIIDSGASDNICGSLH